MSPKELNELLLLNFPNLNNAFSEECDWQEGINTGSIVVFEDIFMPYIILCFEKHDIDEVKRCFEFIEECVVSGDEYQKNVADVAIIENIRSYDISDELSKFLLPKSLESYKA